MNEREEQASMPYRARNTLMCSKLKIKCFVVVVIEKLWELQTIF